MVPDDDPSKDVTIAHELHDVHESDTFLVEIVERYLDLIEAPRNDLYLPLHHAYVYGAGFEMTFDNLWKYRTAHARSVLSWIQDNAFSERTDAPFYTQSYPDWAKRYALKAWLVTELPLMMQQVAIQLDYQNMQISKNMDTVYEMIDGWTQQGSNLLLCTTIKAGSF